MDVMIGETPAGRMKMELFSDIVPKCVMRHGNPPDVNHIIQDSGELPPAVYW